MTPEQIERNRAFIRDLRANEKKSIGFMRDDGGGRCCLCVAYDTAQRLGAKLANPRNNEMPPPGLVGFYGWPSSHSYSVILTHKGISALAQDWNDGLTCNSDGISHPQIADAFEETFPELKQPEARGEGL